MAVSCARSSVHTHTRAHATPTMRPTQTTALAVVILILSLLLLLSTAPRGHASGTAGRAPEEAAPPPPVPAAPSPPRSWVVAEGAFHLLRPERVVRLGHDCNSGDPNALVAVFPPHVFRLWIEVGVYTRTDFWDALTVHANETADVAVWGIEPNARHVASHPAHPSVTLFTAAAADYEGTAALTLWSPTGASLLPLGPAHARYVPAEARTGSPHEEVAVVRLDTLLRLVPARVRVDYVKIDAQGADFAVVRGAGALVERIDSLTVECQDLPSPSDPRLFYEGACIVSDLREWMRANGFAFCDCVLQNADIAEHNCHFGRTRAASERARALFEHKAW